MIDKLKTSSKLYLLVFVSSIFIIGIGAYGILEMKSMNRNTQTLYADRILPLQQLTQMRYTYLTGILATTDAIKNHKIERSIAIKQLEHAENLINTNWQAYLKTYLTSKELQTVQQTILIKEKADNAILSLKQKIQNDKNYTTDNLSIAVNAIIVKINELAQLQILVSNGLYQKNEQLYTSTETKIYLLIIVSLLFAVVLGFFIVTDVQNYINDLKISNHKIKQAESKCRVFIKYAGDSIIILNKNFQITDINDSANKLLNYSQEELLQLNIEDIITPEELKTFFTRIESINKSGYSLHEICLKRKDGSLVDTEMNIRLLEGTGYIAIIRDITERIKSQIIIRESEEKYRYLFQNSPAYIIIWDLESLNILEVNNTVVENYGYSKDEWKTMSILQYRPLEDHDRIKAFAQKMLNSSEPISKSRWRHLKKNGEEMLMEISSHRIIYQDKKAILSLASDVTEQVKAETAFRKSEEKFHSLIDYAPDAIFLVADDGIIFDVNKSAITLLGYTKEELIGKTVLDLHPQDAREGVPLIWDTLRKNKSLNDERLLQRKDGTTVEVEISRNMLPDASGAIAIVRDVTERSLAIKKIKASEERIVRVMQNSPIPLTITYNDSKIAFMNNEFTKTFGYTQEDLPTVLDWWICAYPDETYRENVKKEWFARIERHQKTHKPFEPMESIVHCKDGSNRYIEFHFTDMGDEFLVNFYDITERKLAEQNLKQSEEKHRALIENISDAIVLVDEHWNVVYQSPAVQRIVGFTIEDRKGKKAIDFVHPDDVEICLDQYKKAKDAPGVPFQSQYRSQNKRGGYIWIEVFLMNLLNNESVKSYVVTYRDITERKKLEEQQLLMSSIVNSSNDAIISKTLDGFVTSWNYGAEKVLGYAAKEIIGHHISTIIPLELRQEEKEILEKVSAGHSVDHFETKRINKDGTILDVSITVSPIRDSLGKVVGSSKILRDVTHEKRTQNLLKHQNEKLLEIAYFQSHIVRKPVANVLGLISLIDVSHPEAPENLALIPMLEVASKELDDVIHQIVKKTNEIKTLL